jgi:hypothetical protein
MSTERETNILELFSEVDDLINFLELQREKAKIDSEIAILSALKVKSSLEHLRSALDYCACDLKEYVLKGSSNTNFPYAPDPTEFARQMRKQLNGLSSNYTSIIESVQSYKCHDAWLLNFCRINNKNKHEKLQNQERKNFDTEINIDNAIIFKGKGNQVANDVWVNGKLLGQNGILSVGKDMSDQEIINQIDSKIIVKITHGSVVFIDRKTGINLIDLIKRVRINSQILIERLYDEMRNDISVTIP